jgi:hypothetical protein
MRRRFVAAVSEPVETGNRAAEIDDDEKECRERIDAEMGTEPGQAQRQDGIGGDRGGDEMVETGEESDDRSGEACAIDRLRDMSSAGKNDCQRSRRKEAGNTPQHERSEHGRANPWP